MFLEILLGIATRCAHQLCRTPSFRLTSVSSNCIKIIPGDINSSVKTLPQHSRLKRSDITARQTVIITSSEIQKENSQTRIQQTALDTQQLQHQTAHVRRLHNLLFLVYEQDTVQGRFRQMSTTASHTTSWSTHVSNPAIQSGWQCPLPLNTLFSCFLMPKQALLHAPSQKIIPVFWAVRTSSQKTVDGTLLLAAYLESILQERSWLLSISVLPPQIQCIVTHCTVS